VQFIEGESRRVDSNLFVCVQVSKVPERIREREREIRTPTHSESLTLFEAVACQERVVNGG
jgi:hypothetical protein